MKEKVDVLLSNSAISTRINELGDKISKDYKNKEIQIICILKGSVMFMSDLSKKITVPVYYHFMKVSSYGSGTDSSGVLKVELDLTEPIEVKHVLIIEDIIDSGNTLSLLRKLLLERNPASLKICTLLDKPERRVVNVPVDYTGFSIPDKFVVGYGLDFDQRYRNLDYVGVVSFEEDEEEPFQ